MLRILFAGSPDISATVLQGLIDNDYPPCAVLSNPPKAQGRHKTLIHTPVAVLAQEKNIPLFCPEKLTSEVREQISALNIDLLVCFSYSKIFGPKFLGLFPHGGINIHPSLLPKYRGCAPVPAAILSGETQSGVTIQKLALKMDSGDILIQQNMPIADNDTTESFLKRAAEASIPLLVTTLKKIESGEVISQSQEDECASYCTMLQKEDGLIDWEQSACEIHCQIRAFKPWPVAFTYLKKEIIFIHGAIVSSHDDTQKKAGTILGTDKNEGVLIQTGKGVLAVQYLQKAGKKMLYWKDFLNGVHDFIKNCFVSTQDTTL